jgi:uncharacterized membrane protein
MEADHLRRRVEEGDPFWPAQLAVGIAIALNLPLSGKLTIGPNWLLPVVEGALLIALVTSLPSRGNRPHAGHRLFAMSVVGLVTLVNIVSIGLLVHYLLGHHAHVQGRPLIASGAVLLATNILLFAVWFWEFDRGGPVSRFMNPEVLPDFQFPQMENPQLAPKAWRPGFLDYLYLSLTNATAFSPTDTMPLTQSAKILMSLQSVTSLITIALVVARAVNILS